MSIFRRKTAGIPAPDAYEDDDTPYGSGTTLPGDLWDYGLRSGWWHVPAEPAPTGAQVVAMIERYNAALAPLEEKP